MNDINSLTLFTSESCNLNCSYCDIASHLDPKLHNLEAKKVKESLINGQYLNTIKEAFQKLNIDKYQIENLELWGQEPTLTLKEFNIFFPQLYELCPNIQKLLFSTNGVANIVEIINLIKIINNITNKKFILNLQFSFDGYEQTLSHRGISPNIIIDNIINFIEELNKIDLKLLTVNILPHNVIDQETFTMFSKTESYYENKLYKYLKDFQDLYYLFASKNQNQKVFIHKFGAGIEVPINGTVEDGKNLTVFYEQCEKIGKNLDIKIWKQLPNLFSRNALDWNYEDIISILADSNNDRLIYNKNNLTKINLLSNKLGCSYNYRVLKIRYDGTLIHCQNAIYSLHNNLELNNIDNLIQYRKKNKNFYPNIFTDSNEILDNYIEQSRQRHEESFLASFIQIASLLILLLDSNQIDSKYNNIYNFIKCVYFINYSATCPHNTMMISGNTYGSYLGWIRLLCNGFMDIVWENLGGKNVNK